MCMSQRILSLVVLCVFSCVAAASQSMLASGPTVMVPGAPFQGERVGRLVQKLANGITITHEVRGQIARDTEGRVREEEQQTNKPMFVVVLDPVNHLQMKWSSSSKTATRLPFSGREHVTFPLQPWLEILKGRGWDQPEPGPEPNKVTTEDLGKKTISGVVTTGTRTTTVVPMGKYGNDRVVTIVHDEWFSEDLKLTVLDSVDDPIGGQQTLEIQGITRSEPDPTLFGLPEGYEVKSMFGGGIVGGLAVPPVVAPPKQ
jgi:hypothetical protein